MRRTTATPAVLGFAFACCLASAGAAAGADVEAMRSATVKITVAHGAGKAVGSGIVLCHSGDRLDVLTAKHVVSGVGLVDASGRPAGERFRGVRTIEVAFYRDASEPVTVTARDVRKAEIKDLAVVTLRGVGGRMTAATLGVSTALAAPQEVQSVGHQLALNDGDWFWADGKVQRAGEFVLHSSPITGGFSGGPLFDAAGKVVGVNIQTVAGVARAIRIEEAALTIRSWVSPACLGGDAPRPAAMGEAGRWRDSVLGIEFAWVEPGSFWMGSPEGEPGREDDENHRRVTLSRGFWMATTEVTRGQFAKFVEERGFRTDAEHEGYSWVWSGQGWVKQEGLTWRDSGGADHPVAHVSWNDANAFRLWLSKRSGEEVRLPTAAEWEYAARAGTGAATYAGNLTLRGACDAPELETIAWYCGNAGGRARPVGGKAANSWGLHDMLGNVWEWTADAADWENDLVVVTEGHAVEATDPRSTRGSNRILRGGSWSVGAGACRAANRAAYVPGYREEGLGFRLVRTAP